MEENTITFEVNTRILKEIENEYLEWTIDHMKQVLLCDGFISAQMRKIENESVEYFFYSVIYIVESTEKLDNYTKFKAPSLRKSGIEKFGDKWSIERRIMKNLFTLKNNSI